MKSVTTHTTNTKSHLLIAGLAMLFTLPGTLGAVNIPDCGGDGQKACPGGDFEWALLMDSTLGDRCEYDLQKQNGVCVNETRKTFAKLGGWLGFAMAEQRYRIAGNDPLNFQTWLSAHNAYSSRQQGFKNEIGRNQHYSITDLLQLGYRFLEIDPHWSAGRMVVCHNGIDPCRDGELRLWGHVLLELKKWLEANPGEFIVVKLDDHINGQEAELTDPIAYFLGSKVVRRPTNPTSWPKVNQQLALGKQILFLSRNNAIMNEGWIWSGTTSFITATDHPNKSNLDACTDGDGKLMGNHSYMWWSALAEGRSGSNLLDLTGLMYETDVRKAVGCGANIIGLDFIHKLEDPVWPFNRDGYDGRREASIWSWATGDFGSNGPAAMRADARWVGRPMNESRRYACASTTRTTANWNERGWLVTSASGPWSNGAAVCKSLGNYEFAYPVNGYQNQRLYLAAGGGEVWLNYRSATADMLKATTNVVNFTHIKGDMLPEPATFMLYGTPGASVVWYQSDPGLMQKMVLSSFVIAPTGNLATIALTEAAVNLAPGLHTWQVRFNSSGVNETVTVNLQVRGRTTMQVMASPQTAANTPFPVQVSLTAAPGTSDYKLYGYQNGKFLGTIAAGTYEGGTGGAMNFTVPVNGMTAGTYQITGVNVPRDPNWLMNEAELVTVVVQ